MLGFQLGTAMLGAVQIVYIQQFLYVLSVTLYSIDTEKKNLLSGKVKKGERVFWITLRALRYLIYSYFTCLWRKKT